MVFEVWCRLVRYEELYPFVHKGLLFRFVLGRIRARQPAALPIGVICRVSMEISTAAGGGGVCCRRGVG